MGIEYNTSLGELKVKEFGRNVQNMIMKLRDIDDTEKRNRLAKTVVEVMAQKNPTQRYNEEYINQLWELVYDVGGKDLDIESPVPPKSDADREFEKPDRIPYPIDDNKYKHYGKNILLLIEAAKQIKDEQKKEAIIRIIASYMKIAHRNWNKKESSSEEIIITDLEHISGGALTIDNEVLSKLGNSGGKPSKRKNTNNGQGNNRNNRKNNRKRFSKR